MKSFISKPFEQYKQIKDRYVNNFVEN